MVNLSVFKSIALDVYLGGQLLDQPLSATGAEYTLLKMYLDYSDIQSTGI
jgi:hypothetical protein